MLITHMYLITTLTVLRQSLPEPLLQKVRSSASTFNFQYFYFATAHPVTHTYSRKCVIPVVCVKLGEGM